MKFSFHLFTKISVNERIKNTLQITGAKHFCLSSYQPYLPAQKVNWPMNILPMRKKIVFEIELNQSESKCLASSVVKRWIERKKTRRKTTGKTQLSICVWRPVKHFHRTLLNSIKFTSHWVFGRFPNGKWLTFRLHTIFI